MAETTPGANNKGVAFRGRAEREPVMEKRRQLLKRGLLSDAAYAKIVAKSKRKPDGDRR